MSDTTPPADTDLRTIFARMVAILDELPAIGKNQRNEDQNFMFRGIDDTLVALNPLLAKHGVFVVPVALERLYDHRETRRGTVMHTVHLHVRFDFYGLLGDVVSASTWGEAMDVMDKATSKAHTMAFKTALFVAFSISVKEQQDSDSQTHEETVAAGRAPAAPKPPDFVSDLGWPSKKAGQEAHAAVAERVKALGDDDKARFSEWHADHAEGWFWTKDQLAEVVAKLDEIEAGWEADPEPPAA